MKTLHLSIITIVGIIVIAMATLGVFLEKLNDNTQYTAVNTIDGQKPGSLLEKNCGQFYTVPKDNHFLEVYPVLILQQNATGCAKLTYTINYMYNDSNRSESVWPQMLNFTDLTHINKYNYTTSGTSFGITPIDTTHMFKIKSVPEIVDLAKYPIGSQFTITLVIKPLPNATGFYDDAIKQPPCDSYPLAVGYSLDQINSSDFSKGIFLMHNHSCANGPYLISSVQVSGMDFKLIKFP